MTDILIHPNLPITVMYDYHPDTAPMAPGWQTTISYGIDPYGNPIFDLEHLPEFPVLDLIVIGTDHILINGWLFPYNLLSKGVLRWFQTRLVAWSKASTDPDLKPWIQGISDTFVARLEGNF